jgi:hypothetical protein
VSKEQSIFCQEKECHISPVDMLMERLGCVEILPGEAERLSEIRWKAYLVRTALRLGPQGSFVFDPEKKLVKAPIPEESLYLFEKKLRLVLHKKNEGFSELFPGSDPIILEGVARRLTNGRDRKKQLRSTLDSPDKSRKLSTAFNVLQNIAGKKEVAEETEPHVLLVAHTNTPNAKQIVERVSNRKHFPDNVSLTRKAISAVNVGLMASMTPYLGAAVIGAELESAGVKDICLIDYKDVTENGIAEGNSKKKIDIAMITGLLSIDIRDLKEKTAVFNKLGIRTIVGGLAATIDPNAVILTTGADVFIGEAEGAIEKVLGVLKSANPTDRFIFHRESKIGSGTNEVKIIPDQGEPKIKHVYLGLPKLVDIKTHYSPERERAGQLVSRLKFEIMMQPKVTAFGKEWDPPSWIFKQLSIVVGCPHACSFCSTVKSIGTELRRKPLESIRLEVAATESQGILVVDQNLGAKAKTESYKKWSSYLEGLFRLLRKYDKRIICQTELSTWDRIDTNPRLSELAGKTILAALGGIEQPRIIQGNADKNPSNYARQIGIMRRLGVISVVTAIAGQINGMGKEATKEKVTLSEWKRLLEAAQPDVFVVFPFVKNPGSPGTPTTLNDPTDPLVSYQSNLMTCDSDWEEAFQIENLAPGTLCRTAGSLIRRNLLKRVLLLSLIKTAQNAAHNLKLHTTDLMHDIR